MGTLRLSRISCLRAPLHGRSPMPTPPSPTTASTPSNVPGSMRAGRRVPAALVRRGGGTPHQAQDVVPRRPEMGHEGGTDQTGRSGDDDAHGAILAETAART